MQTGGKKLYGVFGDLKDWLVFYYICKMLGKGCLVCDIQCVINNVAC